MHVVPAMACSMLAGTQVQHTMHDKGQQALRWWNSWVWVVSPIQEPRRLLGLEGKGSAWNQGILWRPRSTAQTQPLWQESDGVLYTTPPYLEAACTPQPCRRPEVAVPLLSTPSIHVAKYLRSLGARLPAAGAAVSFFVFLSLCVSPSLCCWPYTASLCHIGAPRCCRRLCLQHFFTSWGRVQGLESVWGLWGRCIVAGHLSIWLYMLTDQTATSPECPKFIACWCLWQQPVGLVQRMMLLGALKDPKIHLHSRSVLQVLQQFRLYYCMFPPSFLWASVAQARLCHAGRVCLGDPRLLGRCCRGGC